MINLRADTSAFEAGLAAANSAVRAFARNDRAARKLTRARQIARRCYEATVIPPRWVLHLLKPPTVTVTIPAA